VSYLRAALPLPIDRQVPCLPLSALSLFRIWRIIAILAAQPGIFLEEVLALLLYLILRQDMFWNLGKGRCRDDGKDYYFRQEGLTLYGKG